MNTIISIIGPTSTGKSDLAVDIALALKKKGIKAEIISADSRQVYRELNLLSGKITIDEMKGVPHHLLDVVSVKRVYTVEQYKKQAQKIIKNLHAQNTIPIIVGGTGFYIDSVLFDLEFPKVKPNKTLRAKLEKLSTQELFSLLEEKDKDRADMLGPHNRPRLIRALEIVETLGSVPKLQPNKSPYDVVWVGLDLPDQILKERIENRIQKRIKEGMFDEAEAIRKNGVSWKRLESLGLECTFASQFLQKKLTQSEFVSDLSHATWKYAKRQRTWFKRNKDIGWFKSNNKEDLNRIITLVGTQIEKATLV